MPGPEKYLLLVEQKREIEDIKKRMKRLEDALLKQAGLAVQLYEQSRQAATE
jgi:hypothetical protein